MFQEYFITLDKSEVFPHLPHLPHWRKMQVQPINDFSKCSNLKKKRHNELEVHIEVYHSLLHTIFPLYRYSGKTQKQLVEYVRDHYVKRPPFER